MPCNSDHLEPTRRESELHRAARLLLYVRRSLGKPISTGLVADAQDQYCPVDYTARLCKEVRDMKGRERDRIVYDGKNKDARNLADWWEEHQAADKVREEAERKEAERHALRAQALAKLTPEERKALGV